MKGARSHSLAFNNNIIYLIRCVTSRKFDKSHFLDFLDTFTLFAKSGKSLENQTNHEKRALASFFMFWAPLLVTFWSRLLALFSVQAAPLITLAADCQKGPQKVSENSEIWVSDFTVFCSFPSGQFCQKCRLGPPESQLLAVPAITVKRVSKGCQKGVKMSSFDTLLTPFWTLLTPRGPLTILGTLGWSVVHFLVTTSDPDVNERR